MRHYLDLYNEAAKNPSNSRLDGFARPTCQSCSNLDAAIKNYASKNAKQQSNALRVVKARQDFVGSRQAIIIQMDQLPGKIVQNDGTVVQEIEPSPDIRVTYILDWRDGQGWIIRETLKYPGEV